MKTNKMKYRYFLEMWDILRELRDYAILHIEILSRIKSEIYKSYHGLIIDKT